jgi:hypothetical protein
VRFLAYLHPLWQIGSIAVAVWTLSLGLRMRALRRTGQGAAMRTTLLRRHVRAGLAFVGALTAGYAAGPLTLALVRDKPVFRSAHSFFATITLLLIVSGGALGWRLWRGTGSPTTRDLHAYCMGVGLFLATVAAVLGLGLLP